MRTTLRRFSFPSSKSPSPRDPSLAGNETNAETTAPSTGPVIVAPVAIAKRPGRLYVTNQLIGGIRLRQKRLKTTSDCDVNPELQEFYNADCRTGDEETSNWKGVSHRCFEPVKDQTDGYFDCLFDVGRPLASTAGPLEDIEYTLRPFQWLDGATEEVQFQGAFFNAEVRLYSLLTLTFTFENGGYMEKRMKVAAISANMYPTFWYIVPDLIFLAMISQLLYQEGFEVINAKRSGLLSFYLSDFWNLVDWLSIIAGFVISFLWFNIVLRTQSVGDLIADLGPTPETAATSALYQSKWTRIVDDLSSLSDSQDVQFMFLYWYTLVLMLRFFKNFQGQPRLSQISSTLLKSLLDMGHFLIVFAVVFVNFAIGGNLMFGTSSDDWSSIMGAINTSMMALLGNIDMDALMEVSPITAYLWFWSFMVINWYILMNLLVAIVFDHYYSFRDTVGETQGLGSQIADVFFEKSWAIDWYLQRKQYLKKEVIDPMPEYKVFRFFHPKKFGYLFLDEQMSYEEVYEAMVEESPQGEVYGRPTILEQRTEKRNADRAAFEESLRHESKDGGNRLSMLEAEQMAKKRSSSGEAPSSKGGSKEPLSNTGGSGVVVPRSASKNAEPAVSVPAEGTHAMEPPPWWSDGSSSSGSRSPLPSATGPECFTTSRTTFHNQQRGGSASSSSPRTDDEHDSSGGIEMTNFSMRENREREAFSTLRARLARTSSSVSSTTQERHRENKIRAALGGRSSRKLRRYLLQEGAHRMAEGEDEEIEKAERTGEDAVINPDDMMIPDGEKTKQSGGDVDEPPVADENDARPDGKTSPASGANQSPASKDPASQPPGAEGGGGEEGDDAEDGEQQISRQSSKSGSGSKKKLLAKGTMQIQKEQMAYIREPITFEDLEALGVEPRFARHLMLRCHRFVLAETGYEERRKQELTSLAIETGKMLQHVDHDCSGLQKQLAIILDSVVKSCKDLEETIDDTHMSLAKLEKERGVAPCQGTPLSAGHYRETPWNKGQHVTTVPGVRENNMTQARNTLAIMAGSPSASGGASPFGGTGASKFKRRSNPDRSTFTSLEGVLPAVLVTDAEVSNYL
ncbi:unnamed protein product [Amoebophrya sp. A120]|nr:unnamed protein product [Amoebophrya sp. A120]|eukprot:GSA120T00017934001.1